MEIGLMKLNTMSIIGTVLLYFNMYSLIKEINCLISMISRFLKRNKMPYIHDFKIFATPMNIFKVEMLLQ